MNRMKNMVREPKKPTTTTKKSKNNTYQLQAIVDRGIVHKQHHAQVPSELINKNQFQPEVEKVVKVSTH